VFIAAVALVKMLHIIIWKVKDSKYVIIASTLNSLWPKLIFKYLSSWGLQNLCSVMGYVSLV
jgi:hypothetical protein